SPTVTSTPAPTPDPTPTPTGSGPSVSITNPLPEFTHQNRPSFEFTASGQGTLTFICSIDELAGGTPESCSSPKSYALNDGVHTFRVVAVDSFGRRSTTALNRFTLDTTAPSVQITSQPPAQSTSAQASFTFMSTFTSQDGKSGVKGFECSLDSAAF